MNGVRRSMLKQAFVDADTDGNGKMDFDEFQALMKKLDPGYGESRGVEDVMSGWERDEWEKG